jgi:UDP-glucose 4-epimerase
MTHSASYKTELLITGGAGFVGTHVAALALSRGVTPAVLDSLFVGDKNLKVHAKELPLFKVELMSRAQVYDAIAAIRPRRVIHLAALHFIPYCNQHPVEAVESNVIGTRHLLEALEQHRPESIVFASSAAVYPIADGPHREDDLPGPTDIYGHTKWIGEDLLERYTRRTGVSTAAARLFNVYGPHETQPHLIPVIVQQLAAGARSLQLGNLDPARDYIHGEDIASGIMALSELAPEGFTPFNVGTGVEWTVRHVVEMCEKALGRSIEITQDPARMRPSDRPHLVADNSRLRRATGWAPKWSFEDGLADLLRRELPR